MLDFVYENQTGDSQWSEEFFRSVFERASARLNLNNKKVELGLHLVSSQRIQELNREHRGKDKPTDVLSFPLHEHSLEDYGILPLGDIFICLQIAQSQAEESHVSLAQELARLSVHGFLHLMGYNHETSEADEKEMTELEDKILEEIKS